MATLVYWDEVEDEVREMELPRRRGEAPSRLLRRADREVGQSVEDEPSFDRVVRQEGPVHLLSAAFLDSDGVDRAVLIGYSSRSPAAARALVEREAAGIRTWPPH